MQLMPNLAPNITYVKFGTQHRDLVQKYPTFGFLFNFISTFETINKNILFINNLFIIVYKITYKNLKFIYYGK